MRVSISGRAAARGLVLVSALLMTTAAFAASDAKKVADDIVAALQAKGGAKATYGSAAASGDIVTITDFKVTSPKDGEVTIPSLVVTSPTDRQPGGFTATSIAFDSGLFVKGDNTAKWTTGIVNDAVVPAPSEVDSKAKFTPFTHFGIGAISATNKKDQPEPVTIDNVSMDLANVVDGTANDVKLQISGIAVPQAVIATEAQAKATLDQLGYTSLLVNVNIEGGYDPTKETATIRKIEIDGKDMGKLTITGSFGGLTRDKLQSSDAVNNVASTATLENASVRFENAGIAEKILEMQAKSMGTTRDSLAMMLPAALPLAFGQLNITDEAFQKKTVDAVTAFLKDPKSFTVTLNPPTPVPLESLGHQAMSSPSSIPGLLAIDVQANN
ncbi:MAG TPA: hypothetical protein VNX29_23880 [Kaistia sp.]|nr:hypothetical protein [Kaistia sp.]